MEGQVEREREKEQKRQKGGRERHKERRKSGRRGRKREKESERFAHHYNTVYRHNMTFEMFLFFWNFCEFDVRGDRESKSESLWSKFNRKTECV